MPPFTWPASPHEDSFDRILQTNVFGTYNIYKAARTQGCPRVVFASSLHVTGSYDASERISPELPVRPDSFYGASKAWGESLGRLYTARHRVHRRLRDLGDPAWLVGSRPGRAARLPAAR